MELEVYRTGSCYIVGLPERTVSMIKKEPFHLACGEELIPGDKFTEIGSKSSAGMPPIILSDGWFQQYFGRLKFDDAAGKEKEIALFDAFHIESKCSALEEKRKGSPSLTWFIGYSIIGDHGELGYETRARSIRTITCSSITRFQDGVANKDERHLVDSLTV